MNRKNITPIILLILGLMLIISGVIFKIKNWPDAFQGLYTGSVVILISIFLFFRKK